MADARADLAGDEAHPETDLAQQQSKQRVQLITETAAVALDHLLNSASGASRMP